MTNSAITDDEYASLAEFRHELRRFLRFSEAAAEAVGLTPQQHQALLAVRGFPEPGGMTVGGLAERLQIKPHSAVGLVNRLVAQELLTRRVSTTDRRQVFLALTPRGNQLLAELTATHRAEVRRMRTTLQELLQRLE